MSKGSLYPSRNHWQKKTYGSPRAGETSMPAKPPTPAHAHPIDPTSKAVAPAAKTNDSGDGCLRASHAIQLPATEQS